MTSRAYWIMFVLAALCLAAVAISFSGCAPQEVENFTPFAPKAEIRDAKAFADDLKICRSYGLEYLSGRNSLNPLSVASSGAQGALGNLASAAVNPLATGLSGVGSASSEATSEMGLTATNAEKVVTVCMEQRGNASGAYAIMDPLLLGGS